MIRKYNSKRRFTESFENYEDEMDKIDARIEDIHSRICNLDLVQALKKHMSFVDFVEELKNLSDAIYDFNGALTRNTTFVIEEDLKKIYLHLSDVDYYLDHLF